METQTVESLVPKTDKTKLSQKDAVFNFTTEILVSAGKSRVQGEPLKTLVTKEIRKLVRAKLIESLKKGETRLSKSFDESRIKKYASGLINNWLKKDPRFN